VLVRRRPRGACTEPVVVGQSARAPARRAFLPGPTPASECLGGSRLGSGAWGLGPGAWGLGSGVWGLGPGRGFPVPQDAMPAIPASGGAGATAGPRHGGWGPRAPTTRRLSRLSMSAGGRPADRPDRPGCGAPAPARV